MLQGVGRLARSHTGKGPGEARLQISLGRANVRPNWQWRRATCSVYGRPPKLGLGAGVPVPFTSRWPLTGVKPVGQSTMEPHSQCVGPADGEGHAGYVKLNLARALSMTDADSVECQLLLT